MPFFMLGNSAFIDFEKICTCIRDSGEKLDKKTYKLCMKYNFSHLHKYDFFFFVFLSLKILCLKYIFSYIVNL